MSGSSWPTPIAGPAARSTIYLQREGLDRIEGAHCFEFYAGAAAYEALQEQEIGTFYLTDFLARQFDSIIMAGLGLDRHPSCCRSTSATTAGWSISPRPTIRV